MADITRDEFARSIGITNPPPPAPTAMAPATNQADALASTLAPTTQAALNEQTRRLQESRVEVVAPSAMADADFATRLGARPGIPFDVNSGVSFMSRLRAAAQPTAEEEQKALEAAYGKGNVRRNSLGWLVVTKPDAQGKQTDVLVDPIGLDMGDAASVFAKLPEIGGAILTTMATGGAGAAPGIFNAAKTLLAMTVGSAAGGAAKDVLVRAGEGNALQPGEIAARRGEQAAIDLAAGTALGVGAKIGATFLSPFSNTGPLQFQAQVAGERIAQKYGVRLSQTPAEATGNSFLQRAEAMESQKPGASVPFEAMMKRREEQLGELRRLALGGAVPEEEAAGQRALAALGAKVAPLEQDVLRAAAATEKSATAELAAGTGLTANRAQVGEGIRTGAMTLKEQFDAANAANYDAFFSNPLAKAPVIAGKPLKQEVDTLLRELPKVQKAVEVPTFDTYGNPTAKQVIRNVPVETPVRPRLEELSSKLAGGKVSINDLKQIRTDVDNAIKTGEAVPGVKEGRLKALYAKLTGAIEQGLKDINDPSLTAAWRTANDFYKANVGKFERAGINELFRDPSNALNAEEIVDRAITSPGVYRAYKEFFGAGSPQLDNVQQAVRDSVLSRSSLSPVIDAKGFVTRLEALDKASPEALNDAFGAAAPQLRASARALQVAQGDTLPERELVEAVSSGNASAARLQQLISSQNTRDAAYRNELVAMVAKGNVSADKIKPTELVNRFVFKKDTQPADLQGVVALLHDRPDVLEDVRRLTFQKVLDNATSVAPGTGKRTLVANDLEAMLSEPNMVKRLRTALGASTFEDLRLITDFLKPGAVIQQAAKSAGGLSTGQQVAGLVEKGALKYVDRAIKNFFIATAYTSPPIKAYLANTILEPQGKANLVNYVIASTPFVEAVSKTFTEEEAKKVIASMKASVDRTVREDPSQADLPQTREEFMRSIGAQ